MSVPDNILPYNISLVRDKGLVREWLHKKPGHQYFPCGVPAKYYAGRLGLGLGASGHSIGKTWQPLFLQNLLV